MDLIIKPAVSLKKRIRSRTVYVFGAGRRLQRFSQGFLKDYHFEENIDFIIDNNPEQWDTQKEVNGRQITVKSYEYLAKNADKKSVIIISLKEYRDVLTQIKEDARLRKVKIYGLPESQYVFENKLDFLLKRIPLKKYILLQGRYDTCENALALYEYVTKNELMRGYRFVWLVDNPEENTKDRRNIFIDRYLTEKKSALYDLLRYRYYAFLSRYLFYENRLINKHRPDQFSVYLKHGTFMLKNVKGVINIPKDVDYAICTSENYADLASDQESIPREKLLICGSPRLDYLYMEKHVLRSFGIFVEGVKYILWLPTLRQTKDGTRNDVGHISPYGIPIIQTVDDFERLDEELGKFNIVLIIKPHPHQDVSVYKINGYRNIFFITQSQLDEKNFIIHSLMRETAALISDYSSISFDYMLLDKPIAYTIDDINEYKTGFSVEDPFHFMPGEKLKTVDDMLTFMQHVVAGEDSYKEHRREIRDYIHKFQDDRNCERFLGMIGILRSGKDKTT